MWDIKIEQHFVPQVHLKKFVDHHDKKIFVYNKDFRKINKKYYPVQICKRDYLYELSIENPNNRIENTFSYIESRFAQLYEKRLQKIDHTDINFPMTDDERLVILYYVLRLDYWNIANKTTWDEQVWKMWERSIIANCKTKEDLDIAYKKLNEEKKQSEQQRVPIQISVIFEDFIWPLFKTKNIVFIFNKNWMFISSDNPVNNYLAKSFKPWFYGPNIFEINYQVWISPYLIIAIEDKFNQRNDWDILQDPNNLAIISLNSTSFDDANEFIYSPRILSNDEITVYKDHLNHQI